MVGEHAGAGKAHYLFYLIAHHWFIAMNPALRAYRLGGVQYAFFNTGEGILLQTGAFIAQGMTAMEGTAIHANHQGDGLPLEPNPVFVPHRFLTPKHGEQHFETLHSFYRMRNIGRHNDELACGKPEGYFVDDNLPCSVNDLHTGIIGSRMLAEFLAFVKGKEGKVPGPRFVKNFADNGSAGVSGFPGEDHLC